MCEYVGVWVDTAHEYEQHSLGGVDIDVWNYRLD